ncbi:MAG: LysR family transcriptional regulator [Hyphomicrobiales bacterium]|nr:LysR family transcriptional regulator [Hyphomicrobiales bacterium]MCP4998692.1 LysR family transcriptional regulator [Hyphomicrobiales bacterium]
MNQRRVEAFRAVMKSGSITRAAEEMRISQPAVSRLIADLENEIGFKLFERAGGNVTPTEEAQSLLEDVDYFFRGLEGVYSAARDIRELRKGQVRLAVLPNLSFDVAPQIVSEFLQIHPDVKFTMDVLTSPNIVKLVASRHFDLGLAQMADTRPDIKILASYRLKCVCVMSRGHGLAKRSKISAADLKSENVIALSHHTLAAGNITQNFRNANVTPKIKIESQPSFAACALAVKDVGVAIVDPLTAKFFGENRLVAVPFVPDIPFDFRLIQAAHAKGNRASNSFAEEAIAHFDRMADISRI